MHAAWWWHWWGSAIVSCRSNAGGAAGSTNRGTLSFEACLLPVLSELPNGSPTCPNSQLELCLVRPVSFRLCRTQARKSICTHWASQILFIRCTRMVVVREVEDVIDRWRTTGSDSRLVSCGQHETGLHYAHTLTHDIEAFQARQLADCIAAMGGLARRQ